MENRFSQDLATILLRIRSYESPKVENPDFSLGHNSAPIARPSLIFSVETVPTMENRFSQAFATTLLRIGSYEPPKVEYPNFQSFQDQSILDKCLLAQTSSLQLTL